MWLLLLQQTVCVGLSLATLTVLLWAAREYIRARRRVTYLFTLCSITMDGLLDELLDDDTTLVRCS